MTIEQRLQRVLGAGADQLKVIDQILNGQDHGPAIGKLYSMGEACQLLNISRPTLWRLVRSEKIKTVQLLKAKRIPATELQKFVAVQGAA